MVIRKRKPKGSGPFTDPTDSKPQSERSLFRQLREEVQNRLDFTAFRERTSLPLNESVIEGFTQAAIALCEWAQWGRSARLASQYKQLATASEQAAIAYRALASVARQGVGLSPTMLRSA